MPFSTDVTFQHIKHFVQHFIISFNKVSQQVIDISAFSKLDNRPIKFLCYCIKYQFVFIYVKKCFILLINTNIIFVFSFSFFVSRSTSIKLFNEYLLFIFIPRKGFTNLSCLEPVSYTHLTLPTICSV